MAGVLAVLLPVAGLLIAIYLLYLALKRRRGRYWTQVVLILLLTAAGMAGYYQVRLYLNERTVSQSQERYSYREFSQYRLESLLDGADLTLQRPKEFQTVDSRSRQGAAYATLAHKAEVNGKQTSLGLIQASSLQSALAGSESYVAEMAKILGDPKQARHSEYVAPFKAFIVGALPEGMPVKLGEPKRYRGQNLKQAWQIDFSVSDPKGRYSPLTGRFIVAPGAKSFYYFTVESVGYNWQRNASVWDRVVYSVKIDQ